MKSNFLFFYIGTITKPSATFQVLIENNNLSKGFYAVLITATLYTFVYAFLILGGGQPFQPWLSIPLETYYQYNVFFCAPSMFLGWILAAGIVHTLSRFFSSTGTFEQTLIIFGFGISIASWATGVHDLVTSFLGAIHLTLDINDSLFDLVHYPIFKSSESSLRLYQYPINYAGHIWFFSVSTLFLHL